MGPFKADFLRTLSERGYIHQITDAAGLDAHAEFRGDFGLHRF